MTDIKGVVLFADDHIHHDDRPEFRLYQLFKKDFVVLPVDNLIHLKEAILSVSAFDVIILDWEFIYHDPEFDAEFQDVPTQNPMSILEELRLFSKIFVYSGATIPQADKDKLSSLFPGRIIFKQKVIRFDDEDALKQEFEEIKTQLKAFAASNKNLDFSIAWSRAINQSLQSIFDELAAVNEHWVREIYQSSLKDNSNAILEVVELLNNLLSEQLVQNTDLQRTIKTQGEADLKTEVVPLEAAKLFRRIYYTKIHGDYVPFSTGDIFVISDEEYAILITPECEVYARDVTPATTKISLEVLKFNKSEILSEFSTNKGLDKFNQNAHAKHFLPSFPYENEEMLLPACISFLTALETVSSDFLIKNKRKYKLNSPYIQQLRQRYSSWHGRVGVPAVNNLIKTFNASQVSAYSKRLEDNKPKPTPEEQQALKDAKQAERDANKAARKAAFDAKTQDATAKQSTQDKDATQTPPTSA